MRYSTGSLSALLVLKVAPILAQDFQTILTVYPDNTCDPEGETQDLLSTSEMPTCSFGYFLPNDPPWDINEDGRTLNFYVDPSTAPEGCTVVFWEPNFDSDVQCSIPTVRVSSGSSDCIRVSHNMNHWNYGYCCGENCETYIPTSAAVTSIDGNNTTQAAAKNKKIRDVTARDVTAIKRAAPFSRPAVEKRQQEVDGCTFNPSGGREIRSFTPERLVPVTLCTQEEGCELSGTLTASFSYSQTWEIGTEVGATILEVIQASVSFSYSETYTEETSTSVTYGVTVPVGQRGYISFTPLYECYEGSFSGDNCRAVTDTDGKR